MLALLLLVLAKVSTQETPKRKEIDMSVATEKLNEIQDQVLDYVARVQEPLVSGVRTAATTLEDRLPEVQVPWVGDKLPTATQLVDAQFRFRQRLLDNQKDFAKAVLAASLPVRRKFVTESPKGASTTPKTAAKATASKIKAA